MKNILNKLIKSIKSIKFNLFIVIICVGILPISAVTLYISGYYEATQIKERQDKIYNMA